MNVGTTIHCQIVPVLLALQQQQQYELMISKHDMFLARAYCSSAIRPYGIAEADATYVKYYTVGACVYCKAAQLDSCLAACQQTQAQAVELSPENVPLNLPWSDMVV